MIELGPERIEDARDVVVGNERTRIIGRVAAKSEAGAVMVSMSVRRRSNAKEPVVLARTQMRRHRLARSGELEPVISFNQTSRIKRRASLRRLDQMTRDQLGIEIAEERHNFREELARDVFCGRRHLSEGG